MTLDCDIPLEEAVSEFSKDPNAGSARDLLESAIEYWECDFIADFELADHLRAVADFLGDPPHVILNAEPLRFETELERVHETAMRSFQAQRRASFTTYYPDGVEKVIEGVVTSIMEVTQGKRWEIKVLPTNLPQP